MVAADISEKSFLVERFRIESLTDHIYCVYTAHKHFVFEDSKIRSVLDQLSDLQGCVLSRSHIDEILCEANIPFETLFRLLDSKLSLFKKTAIDLSSYLQRVIIHSDHLDLACPLGDELKKISIAPVDVRNLDFAEDHSRSLIVVVLLEYKPSIIRRLYSRYGGSDNLFLLCYVYGRRLYKDNIYAPTQGGPCHFCRMLRQDDDHLDPDLLSQDSWSALSSRLDSFRSEFVMSLPTSYSERGLIVYKAAQWVGEILDPARRLKADILPRIEAVDLQTGLVAWGWSAHHPDCGCHVTI